MHPTEAELRAAEIRSNVESIERVPAEILPADSPARRYLLQLAREGKDVYCYRGAGPHGPWNVWIETERVPVVEFVRGRDA